jgi:hypothetical protein
MAAAPITTADTTTRLDESHTGTVLVGGSHGGVMAGYLSAKAGVRAVVLNDAGVGKDQAGISALPYLDRIGIPAITVGHMTARIADSADMLTRGRITFANTLASSAGVRPGQSCEQAVDLLTRLPTPKTSVPEYGESRFLLRKNRSEPEVWGLDSVTLVRPSDAGRIIVGGSHAALLSGYPDSVLSEPVLAAVFNDAGVGIDGAGIKRLPVLDERGIPAATVGCYTARISDARSTWETGVLSHVNETGMMIGGTTGISTQAFVDLALRKHPRD